jgi:hypothetical protein
LCLPVDKTLSALNTRNSAKELTAFAREYDTGVSTRWSARRIKSAGATKTLFFPLFHRAVTNPEFFRVTRASGIHVCTSRTSMVLERKKRFGIALSQCANPCLRRTNCIGLRASGGEKVYSRFALEQTKNVSGDVLTTRVTQKLLRTRTQAIGISSSHT